MYFDETLNNIWPLGVTTMLMVLTATGYLFIELFVFSPLGKIVTAARNISHSRHGGEITISAENEINVINGLLEDMIVNFQEIILYVWNMTEESIENLNSVEQLSIGKSDGGPDETTMENIKQAHDNLVEMRLTMESMNLYGVRFEGGKALIKEDPKLPD
ncbi:MAG: hypothetical protein HKM93_15395 [Desulfobacteraceae bacterium]|nr:hypothetical protein [Desulfobacteraceae bacterium]